MPSIFWLIPIYLVHWFADFIMQPQDIRENKWHSNRKLAAHIWKYSILWVIAFVIAFCIPIVSIHSLGLIALFAAINISSHWVIDYITSRESHKWFAAKNYWNGFNVVGFDQMLHYLILTISFVVIFKC